MSITRSDRIQEALNSLEEIVDKVSEHTVYNISYGDYVIRRHGKSDYSICKNGEVLYSNISFWTSITAIARCLENNDTEWINAIVLREQKFKKHYNNMAFYANSNKWDMYEQSKIDALEMLWELQRLTSTKTNNVDKYY